MKISIWIISLMELGESSGGLYTVIVAVLYIIGTPIGNLGDISQRAIEIFKSADIIASEDTRHTLKLLNHFGIRTKMLSCRAQNEEKAAAKLIEHLDLHNQQKTSYLEMSKGLADSGVEKWTFDTNNMTITYCDKAGNEMLAEAIK